MIIQIDGTGTHNKGAELMLYAVLQEIERRYPDATVLYNRLRKDKTFINTSLNFKRRKYCTILSTLDKYHFPTLLRRLSIPYAFFTTKYCVKNVNVLLDAGGFQFSDQWNMTNQELLLWERYYQKLKKQGTKIILLPQAFGPFFKENGKKSALMLDRYADVIFARDKLSYKYLLEAGVNKGKIEQYPDFTALVEGVIPKQYESLQGYVCVIPNMKMITKGIISQDQYIASLCTLIQGIVEKKRKVFLLNHEEKRDSKLCKMINSKLHNSLEIADNLNALEIKGLISKSWLVISARYHGIASALNSGVPCFATSWSHKYNELFLEYEQSDCVLNVSTIIDDLDKIYYLLSLEIHHYISEDIKNKNSIILRKNREMWDSIWKYIG